MKILELSDSSAEFSSCGLYRFSLRRTFCSNNRTILFIGLNPSKASSNQDDKTLRRLSSFCLEWGYGSLVVVNLFARISSDPNFLRRCEDPIGQNNDDSLFINTKSWSENYLWDLWFGWGARGVLNGRNRQVICLLENFFVSRAKNLPNSFGPLALGLTLQGHPRHPLYLSRRLDLKPFDWQGYLLACG